MKNNSFQKSVKFPGNKNYTKQYYIFKYYIVTTNTGILFLLQKLQGSLEKNKLLLYIYFAESNGQPPHLFIPSKTATWVPEFAMEGLPLGRIAALVPEFAVKDLPVGRTLMIFTSWPLELAVINCANYDRFLKIVTGRAYSNHVYKRP